MKSKRLPLWLVAIGTLLLVPRTLWVAGSRNRLSDDDARVALQPLNRIHLDSIDQEPISVTLIIPNTTQWTKIRNVWGEPEFVISAVDAAGRFALCLPEMPVRIELIDRTGRVLPLQPDGGPYGYSTRCASSSLRFHAAPGNELTLKLAGTRGSPAPAGDLIVVSDWFNTKDKLVGLDLDKDVESLVKWLSIPGLLLVVSGAGVFFVNRIRHHVVE
jgi:hypothetical protein